MEGIEGINTLAKFLAQPLGYEQIFNQAASRPSGAAGHIAAFQSQQCLGRIELNWRAVFAPE